MGERGVPDRCCCRQHVDRCGFLTSRGRTPTKCKTTKPPEVTMTQRESFSGLVAIVWSDLLLYLTVRPNSQEYNSLKDEGYIFEEGLKPSPIHLFDLSAGISPRMKHSLLRAGLPDFYHRPGFIAYVNMVRKLRAECRRDHTTTHHSYAGPVGG